MREVVINSEREIEGKEIIKYAEVKNQIIAAYKLTLSVEKQKRLSDRDNINHYFMSRTNDYLQEYEVASTAYFLSEQLDKLISSKS